MSRQDVTLVWCVAAAAALLLLIFFLGWRKSKRRREDILHNARRLDDGAFLAALGFGRDDGEDGIVLAVRTALSAMSRLPRQCICPETTLGDALSNGFLSDEIDLPELVMELEDTHDWFEKHIGRLDRVRADDDTTAAQFIGEVMKVYRETRSAPQ